MQFPQQFPYLVIPTGAGPGQQRITINYNQDGQIKVYNSSGNLVDLLGGAQGEFIVYDNTGNMVASIASAAGTDPITGNPFQQGITTYTSTTAINMYGNDITLTASNGTTLVLESGLNASAYFTPSGGPWFAGSLVSTIGGGSHPGLKIASPSDTTNGISSTLELQGSSTTSTTTTILGQATNFNMNAACTFASATVSGNLTALQNLQAGSVSISFAALSSYTQAITFPTAFPAGVTPSVMTNINSSAGVTLRWGSRAYGITNTGFTLFLFKGDAADPAQTWSNVSVQWQAQA